MIRYPEKQKYHNYIDSDIFPWLDLHFPEDSSYNGRIFIGHHRSGEDGLYNLTRRNIGELKSFVSQMHISRGLDYYITANSMSGVRRDNEHVFALHNIVIDIDCHHECGANITEKVVSLIWRCSRDLWTTGEVPKPNSIVMTGRGLQMWWAIDPISVKVSFWYLRLQSWLMDQIQNVITEYPEELSDLTVDRASSSKLSGWFRLPLTYNTKTSTRGALQMLRNERYSMQELLDNYVPEDYTASGVYKCFKSGSVAFSEHSEYVPLAHGDTGALKGCTTALSKRVLKLARLRALRNAPVGNENRDLFCFSVYCSLLDCFDNDDAILRTLEFNKGFKQPLSDSELRQALCTPLYLSVFIFFTVMIKKKGYLSYSEGYRFRFDGRTRIVAVLSLLIWMAMTFATTTTAIANALTGVTGLSKPVLAYIASIFMVIMTMVGGMKGTAWTNALNAVIIYIIMGALAIKSINLAGGLATVQASLTPEYFNILGANKESALAALFGAAIAGYVSPMFFNAQTAAKSEKDAKIGMWVVAGMLMVFSFFPALIGCAAKVLVPDAASATAMYTVAEMFGTVFYAVSIMCVVSAGISTGVGFLVMCANMLTRDFFAPLMPTADDKKQLLFSRLSILALGIIMPWIGLNGGSILGILKDAFVIKAMVGITLVMGIFWKRVTPTAAFWGSLVGVVGSTYWFAAGHPFGISGIWPCGAATIIIIVVLTLITGKDPVPPKLCCL